MRGQIVYVNGQKVGQMDIVSPSDIPFGFIAIPQYVTERILREELANQGVHVERGLKLTAFDQDADGVTATIEGEAGTQTVRAAHPIGVDGAHSVVRKAQGMTFEEQYMLGDVEVDWSLPSGYGIRAMHQTDGKTDDLLVCIPLPGDKRYRMSMLCPTSCQAPASPPMASPTGSRPDANPTSCTFRRCSTDSPPNPPPRETCGSPEYSGSATASPVGTAGGGSSSRATPLRASSTATTRNAGRWARTWWAAAKPSC